MEHKFPRPGPLWRIPCQQDLQLVLVRGVSSPGGGLVGTLIFSVLPREVLNWLRHVNPKSIISSPSLNSAPNSFREYTVEDCARLSLRHVCTHAQTHTHAVRTGPRLHSQKQTSPWASQQILVARWEEGLFLPKHFHAFLCFTEPQVRRKELIHAAFLC